MPDVSLGVCGPAKLPQPLVRRVNDEVQKALASAGRALGAREDRLRARPRDTPEAFAAQAAKNVRHVPAHGEGNRAHVRMIEGETHEARHVRQRERLAGGRRRRRRRSDDPRSAGGASRGVREPEPVLQRHARADRGAATRRSRAPATSWARARRTRIARALDKVRLLAPIPVPPQLRDCNNFEQHMRGARIGMEKLKARWAGKPEPKARGHQHDVAPGQLQAPRRSTSPTASASSGPTHEIEWPPYSEWLDFEGEIGIVIGKQGQGHPAREGARARLRLHDLQRLLRARPAGGRDGRPHGADQGQELRHRQRARPVDRDARRDPRLPRDHGDACASTAKCAGRARPRR